MRTARAPSASDDFCQLPEAVLIQTGITEEKAINVIIDRSRQLGSLDVTHCYDDIRSPIGLSVVFLDDKICSFVNLWLIQE